MIDYWEKVHPGLWECGYAYTAEVEDGALIVTITTYNGDSMRVRVPQNVLRDLLPDLEKLSRCTND